MRRRIYYLLPDVACARRVNECLLLAHIDEAHIHYLAKDGTDMSELHEASLLQSSDIVHGTQMGLMYGGATGLALGIAAAVFDGALPHGAVVLVTTLFGTFAGAWGASMIGSSVPNRRLASFQPAVEAGQILLMADVPKDRVADIEGLLRQTVPTARHKGMESHIPAFP